MRVDDQKLQKQYTFVQRRLPMMVYMWTQMPAGAFAGMRIDHVDNHSTVVSVPGGRRTQNPFGTTYWAVQGMAAELATALIPTCISRCSPMKLRMFVVGTQATFGRKAYGRCRFTCLDAYEKSMAALRESLRSGQSVDCNLTVRGVDPGDETVSEWTFTWNFLATEKD